MVRDILVVGGGPSGLVAAAEAALAGAEVTVVEEDKEVGRPDHCAGLVSKDGLDKVLRSGDMVLSRIRRVRIFSPRGKVYEVPLTRDKAVVIDRERFDFELMKIAEKVGVEVILGTRYEPPMDFKVMINAEGTKGRVARTISMEIPKSIPAAQVDVEVKNFEGDVVEIYTGGWAPRFFAWTVPRRDQLRVGLATDQGLPRELLRRFTERNESFRGKGVVRETKEILGKVVVGGPVNNAVKGNVVAVGDAAGFSKPTTGGGVVLGCLTAKLAGGVTARAVCRGDPLSEFDREWKKLYLKNFNKMRVAAKIFRNMKEKELETVMEKVFREELLSQLVEYDMDLQGRVVDRLARSGIVIHAILPFLRSLFEG